MEDIFMGENSSSTGDDFDTILDLDNEIRSELEGIFFDKKKLLDIIKLLYCYPLESVFLRLTKDIYIKYKILYKPENINEKEQIINIIDEKI